MTKTFDKGCSFVLIIDNVMNERSWSVSDKEHIYSCHAH